ncbi:regulatory protein RecX [Propionibacteriaceae bacterium Y1923]|uniref:regulatory protein RecX n=1 Tax=Aestuariimicrobium sp. Y1814 TaxID=3418742 RepID=UPI003C1FCE50
MILRRLSLRAHSRAELARALTAKGIDPEVQQELLDRFEELDLVGDQEFAEQWVESRHRSRGLSRRALAEELRRKGIDADLVTAATSTLDRDDEVRTATAVAQRKLRSMASVSNPVVVRRRLSAALARRGYGTDVALQVVNDVLSDRGQEDEGDAPDHGHYE